MSTEDNDGDPVGPARASADRPARRLPLDEFMAELQGSIYAEHTEQAHCEDELSVQGPFRTNAKGTFGPVGGGQYKRMTQDRVYVQARVRDESTGRHSVLVRIVSKETEHLAAIPLPDILTKDWKAVRRKLTAQEIDMRLEKADDSSALLELLCQRPPTSCIQVATAGYHADGQVYVLEAGAVVAPGYTGPIYQLKGKSPQSPVRLDVGDVSALRNAIGQLRTSPGATFCVALAASTVSARALSRRPAAVILRAADQTAADLWHGMLASFGQPLASPRHPWSNNNDCCLLADFGSYSSPELTRALNAFRAGARGDDGIRRRGLFVGLDRAGRRIDAIRTAADLLPVIELPVDGSSPPSDPVLPDLSSAFAALGSDLNVFAVGCLHRNGVSKLQTGIQQVRDVWASRPDVAGLLTDPTDEVSRASELFLDAIAFICMIAQDLGLKWDLEAIAAEQAPLFRAAIDNIPGALSAEESEADMVCRCVATIKSAYPERFVHQVSDGKRIRYQNAMEPLKETTGKNATVGIRRLSPEGDHILIPTERLADLCGAADRTNLVRALSRAGLCGGKTEIVRVLENHQSRAKRFYVIEAGALLLDRP